MEPEFESYLKQTIPVIKKRVSKFAHGNSFINEDLYSTALEKIWLYRGNFKGNIIDFQKWVSIIVKNAYIDMYRRKPDVYFVDVQYINISNSFNIINKIDSTDKIDAITKSVEDNFNSFYFGIFKMHFIDGYIYDDVASHFKVPIGTVKNRIFKMRRFIIKNHGINSRTNRGPCLEKEG